jgi:hypothetical protein
VALLCALLGFTASPCLAALTIERLGMHQFEDGPLLDASHVYLPGETVYVSCRIAGFQAAVAGEQRGVKLSWDLKATDAEGIPVTPAASGRIDSPVFAQDKDWLPKFTHNFVIPPFFTNGTVHLEVQIQDDVGKAQLRTQLDLRVRGREVQPSDSLTGRNLHFQKTETDAKALVPAVYHPGETLWARFDIAGFKYGPKNKFDVEYGLAILREDGEQVFAQPAAANDTHESFYPQRYVPGAISLNLDPVVPEGSYTLVITMRDKVGEQSADVRAPFRIAR